MANNKSKTYGLIATIIFHAGIIILLLLLAFKPSPPPYPDPDGILINFGDETQGAGQNEPKMTKSTPEPQQETQQENLTQDYEDAPSVEEKTTEVKKEKPKEEVKKVEKETKDEPEEPKINQNALFPSDYSSNSTSQGNSEGSGNEGTKDGSPLGTGDVDLGKGIKGITYSLKGRKAVKLTPPKYPPKNVEGVVKLKIVVDNKGDVISATLAQGSTTADPDLIKAAITAAYKTKFTKDMLIKQQGYITYEFKLR